MGNKIEKSIVSTELISANNSNLPLGKSKTSNNTSLNADKSVAQLNQTVGNTVVNNETQTAPKETKDFWVTKSTDSKTLTDNLLTEHFNFDKTDIEAYEITYGKFIVNDEKKCEIAKKDGKPCAPAESADIDKWQTVNGKVPITLSAQTIKHLQNFRQERLVDRLTSTILDENLRGQVRNDLLKIATSENQNRTEAANRLMYLENVNEKDSKAVREAIQTVVNLPENKENPMTNLVAAKLKLDDAIKRQDLRGVTDAEWQMNKAVKLIQGQDTITGEIKKDAKVDRQEAAWVNRQVANTLRSLGREKEANEREMLARFYEVDDAERKSVFNYPLGEIDRWKNDGTTFVRPVSEAEQNWREYQDMFSDNPKFKKDLGENKFKFEWKVPKFSGEKNMVEVGGTTLNPVVDRQTSLEREKLNGSLRVTGITKIETTVNVEKNGKIIPKNNPYYGDKVFYRNNSYDWRTMQSPELNQNGINRAIGVGRGVDLINQFNKWTPIVVDVFTGRSRVAERNRLEEANKLATKFPVPPKPEDLPKEREKLLRMVGNDQKGKTLVNEMMRDLEIKSHAFWNR